ncbi:MAG TPA: ABC transporter substrate-binding protein [Mycobacteriales bacterium]|nr:ABC transporter substrate-binding protein [Mycobacteriales bacterium]
MLAAAAVVGVSACGGSSTPPSGSKSSAPSGGGSASTATYTIPSLLDFSGPFASRGKPVLGMQQTLVNWFNANAGAADHIKLVIKPYDTGFDVNKTLTAYNQAISDSNNVLAMLLFGDPNVFALAGKLPGAKIPAAYGGPTDAAIKSGSWVFSPLGDFGDYYAAVVKWRLSTWTQSRQLRVAFASFDGIPAQGWIATLKKDLQGTNATIVDEEYPSPTATSVTVNVNRIVASKPDVVIVAGTDGSQPLYLAGLHAQGIPAQDIVNSQHEGFGLMQALKVSPDLLNGTYEVTTERYQDHTTQAYQIYSQYSAGQNTRWAEDTLLHFPSVSIMLQAIDRAAKAKGSNQITGQDVYNQLTNGTFDGYGLLSQLTYHNSLGGPTSVYVLKDENGTLTQVATLPLGG